MGGSGTRVLVTGGCGFIGSNFVHHLLHSKASAPAGACCPEQSRYATVPGDDPLEILNIDSLTYAADRGNLRGVDGRREHRFLQADVCDAKAVEAAFDEFRPEAVVHFAAESHVDRSIEAGLAFARTNVVGTQVLLDAARRNDTQRVIHISTDEVYGSIAKGSFGEADPMHPASPYSASKAGSDLLALAHHKTYGLAVVVARCTNNYGPRQHPEKLVAKTISRGLRGERVPVYAMGANVRDWLFVKDHCAALELLLRSGEAGSAYNIAGRTELPNLDVVRRILAALGRPESLIEFVADRPGHDWRYSLEDSRIRALGWKPQTPFDVGLAETITWYRQRLKAVTAG